MKKYLDEITKLYSKAKMSCLTGAINEKKLLYLYAFYHYYYGDEECLYDIDENCDYRQRFDDYAQGFFECDDFDEKTIDILIPYYIEEGDAFDKNQMRNHFTQTLAVIQQMNNNFYGLAGHDSKLRDYWDPTDKETKLNLKMITNFYPDFDTENEIKEYVSMLTTAYENISSEIVFGNEIENEISQLTSDAKYVEESEFDLDRPNNALYFGEEKSVIVNVTAKSLQRNYAQYGKAGLFAMNLRFYVANKKVDEGIERSIREEGEKFWYLNNGIIIVCDDYEIVDNKIKLKNFSIVNGGQTTRMIGVIPFVDDFYISAKIIKNKYADDREANIKFVSAVAEASNTQKPINSTDIIANRFEQKLMKQDLAEANIFMQIKRGDTAVANLKENYPEKWQRTKNDVLAQLLYSSMYQKPGTARNSKNTLFSDVNKYNCIFGTKYDTSYIKDLLYLQTYYKEWASVVKKDVNADATKKGLVKNGEFFFIATANVMAKFTYSKELVEKIKELGYSSEVSKKLICSKSFNHRLFNKEFKELKSEIFALFQLIYDKYIGAMYLMRKEIQPDLAYSNFTKIDKNYMSIVERVFDDFSYEVNPRVIGVLNPLLYVENDNDIEETHKLFIEALNRATRVGEDDVDPLEETLREKLIEFRTTIYKEKGIKAFEVFNNKELDALVQKKPRTLEELYRFYCLKTNARYKFRYYGQAIVDVIVSVYGNR